MPLRLAAAGLAKPLHPALARAQQALLRRGDSSLLSPSVSAFPPPRRLVEGFNSCCNRVGGPQWFPMTSLDVDSIIDRLLAVRGPQSNRTVQLAEGEIRALCAAAR